MAAPRRAHRARSRAAALFVLAAGARLLAVSDAMGTNELGFARTGPSSQAERRHSDCPHGEAGLGRYGSAVYPGVHEEVWRRLTVLDGLPPLSARSRPRAAGASALPNVGVDCCPVLQLCRVCAPGL
jgi:hypothetical protein